MNKDITLVPSAIPVSMFLSKFGQKLQQERLRTERENSHALGCKSSEQGFKGGLCHSFDKYILSM